MKYLTFSKSTKMTYNLDQPKVHKMTHNCDLPKVSKIKKLFFVKPKEIKNAKSKELKTIAKIRDIKGYKSMSEDRLLSALKVSESLKESEKNLDETKPEKKLKPGT